MHDTISFTATPMDARCQWWAKHIPAGFAANIDLADTASLSSLPFLRKGADLELEEGDCVLTSEALHHRKPRGYIVLLHIVHEGDKIEIRPSMELKMAIKAIATKDQWASLKNGSGDVAGVLRAAMAFSIFSAEQRAKLMDTARF